MYVDPKIEQYVAALLAATHRDPRVARGVPSDKIAAVIAAASELALANGRSYVTPDNVKRAAPVVLRECIELAPTALQTERDDVIATLIDNVEVP